MSHSNPGRESKTDNSIRDLWNTAPLAIGDARHLIGQEFTLDACAIDAAAAKADQFITPEIDALKVDWLPEKRGAVWCNPPFSQKLEFLDRAYEQAKKHNLTICVMIPYERISGWWRNHVHDRASIVYVPDGRYNYAHAETKKVISGVNFASCFVVFTSLTMPTVYVDFMRGVGKV